ncbi:C39 family peptidase [Micromonospora sp. M12]
MRVGFPVAEVVPSWTADTPDGCWIEVDLRGWDDDGPSTGWYRLARWAADDHAVRRTSVPGQRDGDARVDTDTLIATGATITGWQARVTVCRPSGSPTGPSCAASARSPPAPPRPASVTSRSRVLRRPGRVLDVPRYSQRLHAGQYPQWGGGGDSWCSPTCTSMVLAFWVPGRSRSATPGGAARPASGGGARRPALL